MPYASVEAFKELRAKACDSHFLQAHRTKRRRTGAGTPPKPSCAHSSNSRKAGHPSGGCLSWVLQRPVHRKML